MLLGIDFSRGKVLSTNIDNRKIMFLLSGTQFRRAGLRPSWEGFLNIGKLIESHFRFQ